MKSFLPKLTAIVSIFFFLGGCNKSAVNHEQDKALNDSTMPSSISPIAAREKANDNSRKFIRTADLKFKVKDAIHSTADIENITLRNGGFVNYTKLASTTDYTTNTKISKDSTLERVYFTLSNQIVLRIPNDKLDTTLKEIAKLVDFLDHRIITADDVALQILANSISQQRVGKSETRISNAIEKNSSKLDEVIKAEEARTGKEQTGSEARLKNLSLQDQIKFSTVSIAIYQQQSVRSELKAIDNVQDFEPGLGSRLLESIINGWKMLEGLLLLVVNLWSIILIAIIGLLVFRKRGINLKISK